MKRLRDMAVVGVRLLGEGLVAFAVIIEFTTIVPEARLSFRIAQVASLVVGVALVVWVRPRASQRVTQLRP